MPNAGDSSTASLGPGWVSQSELSRALNTSRQTVGKMLKRHVISGAAVTGAGREMRINVEMAKKQIRARRDVGQAMSNGAKTKVAPSRPRRLPPRPDVDDDTLPDAGTDLDEAIKREKLIEIQNRNRRTADEEAIRSGRYSEAAATSAAMTRMAADMLRILDGALSDLAADVAARHKANARDEVHAMRKAFTSARTRMAADAAKAAAAVPKFMPPPAAED